MGMPQRVEQSGETALRRVYSIEIEKMKMKTLETRLLAGAFIQPCFPCRKCNPTPSSSLSFKTRKKITVALSTATTATNNNNTEPQAQKKKKNKRVFFLDVNPLCYDGSKPSLHSFARWLSLFLSQVSHSDPVIAVISLSLSRLISL